MTLLCWLWMSRECRCFFIRDADADDRSTSGLDASIALNVMQVLRDIAATGRTVIGKLAGPRQSVADPVATIHQPRSDIWQLADNVTLLAKGGVVAVSHHDQQHLLVSTD